MLTEDSSTSDWKDYLTEREQHYEKMLTGVMGFISPTSEQAMYDLLRTIAKLRKENNDPRPTR